MLAFMGPWTTKKSFYARFYRALDILQSLYLNNNNFSQQSKDILKIAMSKTKCSMTPSLPVTTLSLS